jgi:DNA-binding transcriptional regulator/RsmH inhibitor MraZ
MTEECDFVILLPGPILTFLLNEEKTVMHLIVDMNLYCIVDITVSIFISNSDNFQNKKLTNCFKFENNCQSIARAQFQNEEVDRKGKVTLTKINWLIAGINKEIQLIDMNLYLEEEKHEESKKDQEERQDDVLHPKVRFTGLVGEVLCMKVLDNFLYTGHSDQKIML